MMRWKNWSGVQSCQPQRTLHPRSEDELAKIVKEAVAGVRVAGASHSFSALVPTNETLISLDQLTGVIETDPVTHQATCWAGTPLQELGEPLWNAGLSISVQGDVDHQTLGGATGTGTHGTGTAFGCMSAAVVGFRLLRADGSFIDCDADNNPEIFQAGRVSLGSFGIMTQIRIQCEPAFQLLQNIKSFPLADYFQQCEQLNRQHRHVEFFGFPCTDRVILEMQDVTTEPATRVPPDLDDYLLWTLSETGRFSAPLSRWLQRKLMQWLPSERRVDRAYKIFPSKREVRFNEVEYAIPPEHFVPCYQELLDLARCSKTCFGFPFECRWVKADDIWLSPFYERDAVVLSVHRYHKQPYHDFFDAAEEVFCRYEGRPHWGKLHSLRAEHFEQMYPRWSDFCELRRQVDPTGKFANEHLATVFGSSRKK